MSYWPYRHWLCLHPYSFYLSVSRSYSTVSTKCCFHSDRYACYTWYSSPYCFDFGWPSDAFSCYSGTQLAFSSSRDRQTAPCATWLSVASLPFAHCSTSDRPEHPQVALSSSFPSWTFSWAIRANVLACSRSRCSCGRERHPTASLSFLASLSSRLQYCRGLMVSDFSNLATSSHCSTDSNHRPLHRHHHLCCFSSGREGCFLCNCISASLS